MSYKYLKYNPPYSILSSAINYRSKYEYMTGNPSLEKQRNKNLSLNVSWKWIYLSTWYRYAKNSYMAITQAYNDGTHPGVRIIDYQNIPSVYSYGGAITLSPKFGIWKPQTTINLSYSDADLKPIGLDYNWRGPYWYFMLDNSFNLPKGWFLNVQGTYVPKFKQRVAEVNASGVVRLRLSKSFLKDKALVSS